MRENLMKKRGDRPPLSGLLTATGQRRGSGGYSPVILCLFLATLLSCYSRPPGVQVRPEESSPQLKRIAVLPLDNLSGEEGAGEKMTEIFVVELMRQGRFEVAEPGQVKKAMMEKRIRTTRDLDLEAARWLGETLGLDLILVGSVLEFEIQESQTQPVPVVTVISRLLEADTGATLWAAYESRKGDDRETLFGWGRITSLSQLGDVVASEMLRTLNVE